MAEGWCVKEFFPLAVKCVHLRGHDSVTVHFSIKDHPLTLLMLVRGTLLLIVYEKWPCASWISGSHHDLSLLNSKRTQSLTNGFFLLIPFGNLKRLN